jgi:hypothetical protein
MEVSGQIQAPAHFTPGETAHGTYWIRGRVGSIIIIIQFNSIIIIIIIIIIIGRSGTGAGFLLVLGFPLPILIPPTAPYSLIILSSTPCSLET